MPRADDWIVRAVESTGDGPAIVLVADPEQWPRLYSHLRVLAPALPAGLAAHLDSVADPS
ncbi:hypothetical protein [Nannocystis pusilla]|uniref:Uncharacterized protein n=1 Tax=Nannocystis pusilla TaxID=889268 RepID=A0ABS7TXS2_9BACT|nr:hypothetical protein [Nannocystis pusilla]MBZ5712989.1 hypothetical protein [Nannocystis pusilla]